MKAEGASGVRLNVGCGEHYIPGYTNVDIRPDSVADVVAPADGLDFVPAGGAREIVSYQLIEHLGLVGANRALAHWAVKLEPGGRLAIETPDMDSSLTSLSMTRAPADTDWLFGSGDRGQAHIRPFFTQELKDILRLLGYTDIRKRTPLGYWKKNAVRVEARMGPDPYRARVVEGWCALAPDQGTFSSLPSKVIKAGPTLRTLAETCVISPELALIMVDSRGEGERKTAQWRRVLLELKKGGLTLRLFCRLMRPGDVKRSQERAVRTVTEEGASHVSRCLKAGETSWDGLPLTREGRRLGQRHNELSRFFCGHTINRMSVIHCSLGIRAFAGEEYKAALGEFNTSIALDRDNTISLWNLARLRWMAGERGLAQELYDRTYLISKDPGILKERKRTVPVKRPLELSYASQV